MKKKMLVGAALLLASAMAPALAAPVVYEFESVTAINMHVETPYINGVLRNTTTPINLTWAERTANRFVLNRCLPLLITMMEKPGKYWLSITVDQAVLNNGLSTCGLFLR